MAKRVVFFLLSICLSATRIYAQQNERPPEDLVYYTPEAVWSDFMSTEPNNSDLVSLLNTPWADWSFNELNKKDLSVLDLISMLRAVKSEPLRNVVWKELWRKNPTVELVDLFYDYGNFHDLLKYRQAALPILWNADLDQFQVANILKALSKYDIENMRKFWSKFGINNYDPYFNLEILNSDIEEKIRKQALHVIFCKLKDLNQNQLNALLQNDLIKDPEKTMIAEEIFFRVADDFYNHGYYYPDDLELLTKLNIEPYRSLAIEFAGRIDKKRRLLDLMQNNNQK